MLVSTQSNLSAEMTIKIKDFMSRRREVKAKISFCKAQQKDESLKQSNNSKMPEHLNK